MQRYVLLRAVTICCLLYSAIGINAQNLVLNPSFEDHSGCPSSIDQLSNADHWQRPTDATSDWFNSCALNAVVGVPANPFGHEPAADGNAFTGIVTYVDVAYAPTFANYREYLGGELFEPLEAGKEYTTGFKVTRADVYKFATSNFGIHFSDTAVTVPVTGSNYPVLGTININPQVEYTGAPITDSSGWQQVSGNFIANGGEQFVVIGNFRTDSLTDITLADPSLANGMAYYFLDAVFLERVYHAPIAISDTVTMNENTTVNVAILMNDYDTDGVLDPSSLSLESAASNGLATADAWTELLSYTPDTDFTGFDEVTYRICDEEGLCDTATVVFQVLDMPVEPSMMDDYASVEAGDPVSLFPLSNDLAGDYSLDPASIVLDPLPAGLVATLDPVSGSLEITNNILECNSYQFMYTACDDYGYCGSAQITVEWNCYPPDATDDLIAIDANSSVQITPFDNDAEGTTAMENWTFSLIGTPQFGLADWNPATYVLDYQGAESSAGLTDTFSYLICDELGLCDRAMIEVRIADAPDDPSGTIQSPVVVPEVFTPNGDGINDVFHIENLSDWPDNRITIFNRWEQTVYATTAYGNDWNGSLQKSGEPLPNGTYFLILILDTNDPSSLVYKGFTTILK